MATEKALRAAAKEVQKVMGLEPPIDLKASLEDLTDQFKEAIEQIQEGDEFSDETQAIIDEFNEAEEEEAPAPKKKAAAPKKKAPVIEDEDEDEEEDDEEEIPVKKGAKKPARKVVEEDEEEDDDEAPAPKKAAKGKATPFVSQKEKLGTNRMIEVAKAMAKIKGAQDIETVAKAGDANFVKAGGASNLKQSKNIVKVLLPAAETWGVVTVGKGGKLSN